MALSLALGECVCECDVSVCTIAVRVCVVKTSVLTYQLVESGEFQQKCLVSTRKAKRLTLNSSSNGFFFFYQNGADLCSVQTFDKIAFVDVREIK